MDSVKAIKANGNGYYEVTLENDVVASVSVFTIEKTATVNTGSPWNGQRNLLSRNWPGSPLLFPPTSKRIQLLWLIKNMETWHIETIKNVFKSCYSMQDVLKDSLHTETVLAILARRTGFSVSFLQQHVEQLKNL
jgi:hypothetical protein